MSTKDQEHEANYEAFKAQERENADAFRAHEQVHGADRAADRYDAYDRRREANVAEYEAKKREITLRHMRNGDER